MGLRRYREKLLLAPMPAGPGQARILLRYGALAQDRDAAGNAAVLQGNLDLLAPLLAHGFFGARAVQIRAASPAPGLVEIRLAGAPLPRPVIVIALRLAIALHDADPQDLALLAAALGDETAARGVWAGFDFATGIDSILLQAAPQGAAAFDPFHTGSGDILHEPRLVLGGDAALMPGPVAEDAILRLSGLRAFLPPGAVAEFEPGEEEWFVAGNDLLIDRVSIETESLQALLACLALQAGLF